MSENRSTPLLEIATFIGVEAAGKTTVSTYLAQKLGGQVLRVTSWPTLERFLESPDAYAYRNQKVAMEYTQNARDAALLTGLRPLLADSSPDRVHLVHSWHLKRQGMLNENEWGELEKQYINISKQWGPHYIYLHTDLDTIVGRLRMRARPEDIEYNANAASIFLERWENIVADPTWRNGKQLLEVDATKPLDDVCNAAELWIRKHTSS